MLYMTQKPPPLRCRLLLRLRGLAVTAGHTVSIVVVIGRGVATGGGCRSVVSTTRCTAVGTALASSAGSPLVVIIIIVVLIHVHLSCRWLMCRRSRRWWRGWLLLLLRLLRLRLRLLL